jgi:hypothetical protein
MPGYRLMSEVVLWGPKRAAKGSAFFVFLNALLRPFVSAVLALVGILKFLDIDRNRFTLLKEDWYGRAKNA